MRQRSFIESGDQEIVLKLPLIFIAILLFAGCGNAGAPSDAKKLAEVLSGESKGAASGNAICRLFSADELSAYSGAKLGPPENSMAATGCVWSSSDYAARASISVYSLEDKVAGRRPTNISGYRAVPEVGKDGYVFPESGGWAAGASSEKELVFVQLVGPKATDATAIALLAETMRRRR